MLHQIEKKQRRRKIEWKKLQNWKKNVSSGVYMQHTKIETILLKWLKTMTKMSEQNNSKKVLPKRKRKHSKRHTTGRGEGSLGYKQISKIISFDNQARNDKNNKIITIIYSFSFSYFDVIIFYIIFFPRCIVLMCSLFIFYIFPNGVF